MSVYWKVAPETHDRGCLLKGHARGCLLEGHAANTFLVAVYWKVTPVTHDRGCLLEGNARGCLLEGHAGNPGPANDLAVIVDPNGSCTVSIYF